MVRRSRGRASSSGSSASGRSIPPGVQLGYHFCHGHERAPPGAPLRRPAARRHGQRAVAQPRPVARLGPSPGARAAASTCASSRRSASSPCARRRRLYLGLLHPSDGLVGARARIVAAQRFVHDFGVATDCGWARHRPQDVEPLIELHRDADGADRAGAAPARRLRLAGGLGSASPTTSWTARAGRRLRRGLRQRRPATAGTATSTPRSRSWPTCSTDGDILVDYSGGTGILLDRLKLRMFDTAAGAVIVDSSPKFLRVALEKFRDDPRGRAAAAALPARTRSASQRLDEVLGARARRARRRRHRVDQRRAPVPRPGRHRRVVAAGPAPRWPRADQLRQHPQPARPAQRVDPRRDRVGGRRPRRGPRAHRPGVRRLPRRCSTTPSGWRPTPPTATACSSSPGRWSYYLETLELAGLKVESVREASIEARVDDWYELLRTYHDAVLGWVGGTEKIDGAAPSPGGRRRPAGARSAMPWTCCSTAGRSSRPAGRTSRACYGVTRR